MAARQQKGNARAAVQACTGSLESRNKAILIAKAARAKKADDVVVLDMRKVSNFAEFFVIASAASDRKVKAIADGIEEALEKKGLHLRGKEGYKEAAWILIDAGAVVAHVFYQQARDFYALERLWADAKRVKIG